MQYVQFLVSEEQKRLRDMMIFQHRLIIVQQCHLVMTVDQEDIAEAGMIDVVRECGHDRAQVLERRQLEQLCQPAVAQEDVESLEHVGRVCPRMVGRHCHVVVAAREAVQEVVEDVEVDVVQLY